MTSPVEVSFVSKKSCATPAETAPDFPNVELKSADSMFLALILYLSWQRKDGSIKRPGSLTSQNSNYKKKDSAISVQDEHDCLCAAFSSLRNLFHHIGINTTVMGTRDVYCNSDSNQLMNPINIRWRIMTYPSPPLSWWFSISCHILQPFLSRLWWLDSW